MTTGTKTRNEQYQMPNPYGVGTLTVGRIVSKTWSGLDNFNAQTPRSSYPLVSRTPRGAVPDPLKSRLGLPRGPLTRSQWLVYCQAWNERSASQYQARLQRDEERAKWKQQKRLAKRLLPPKPYSMTAVDETIGYVGLKDKRNANSVPQCFAPRDPWGGAVLWNYDPAHDYAVINKLYSKVYGSGFNPLVFLAEGHKALKMIGDSAIGLNLAIGSLIKRDWRGFAAALSIENNPAKRKIFADPRRTVADKWLIFSYGWKPLVKDLQDGAQWLAEMINGDNVHRTKVMGRRVFAVPEYSPVTKYEAAQWDTRITVFQLQYILYGMRAVPTALPTLHTYSMAAWELLPYSFVADWVVPIGSYLAALRTADSLKGTVVKTVKASTVYTRWGVGQFYTIVGSHTPAGGPSYTITKMARTVQEGLTIPSPVTGVAEDASFLTWRRAVSAVALLAQKKWKPF